MIISSNGLNRYYNDIIMEYIGKGYVISPTTMYGTSDAHVDLVNPKHDNHIIRVWMFKDYATILNGGVSAAHRTDIDAVYIEVRKHDRYRGKSIDLWRSAGQLVSEKIFYCVSKSAYTDEQQEIIDIMSLRRERRSKKFSDDSIIRSLAIKNIPEKLLDKIMNRINSVRGFKRATASCINSICVRRREVYDYNTYKYVRRLSAEIDYSYNGKSGKILYK